VWDGHSCPSCPSAPDIVILSEAWRSRSGRHAQSKDPVPAGIATGVKGDFRAGAPFLASFARSGKAITKSNFISQTNAKCMLARWTLWSTPFLSTTYHRPIPTYTAKPLFCTIRCDVDAPLPLLPIRYFQPTLRETCTSLAVARFPKGEPQVFVTLIFPARSSPLGARSWKWSLKQKCASRSST
jgi:hypothetical protein